MITKNLTECPRCGKMDKLIKHHISYIPEIIERICRSCNGKNRRKIKCRGPYTVLTYPQNDMAILDKNIMRQFNSEILELEMAPISPIGVIFPYGMDFDEVIGCLPIITSNLRFRKQMERKKKNASKKLDRMAKAST